MYRFLWRFYWNFCLKLNLHMGRRSQTCGCVWNGALSDDFIPGAFILALNKWVVYCWSFLKISNQKILTPTNRICERYVKVVSNSDFLTVFWTFSYGTLSILLWSFLIGILQRCFRKRKLTMKLRRAFGHGLFQYWIINGVLSRIFLLYFLDEHSNTIFFGSQF